MNNIDYAKLIVDPYKCLSLNVGGFSSKQKKKILTICIENLAHAEYLNEDQIYEIKRLISNNIKCDF
jgi:hypothetical protein